METDVPIVTPDEDRFGYEPFASALAPSLILPTGAPSLVVGVEAGWGAGKTSFFNLVRHSLAALGSPPLIVNYQPWVYSTVDSLLVGFCKQLAAQLENRNPRKYEQISTALDEFSHALSPLANLSEHHAGMLAAAGVMKVFSRLFALFGRRQSIDISNARARVQAAITEYAQPIVIFVDDIDRLPPSEIRLLFQFIKAVGAFDGVAYVLAYDPLPVERALSFNDALDGREYLKKLIQLPIKLPRISHLLLQRYFKEAVQRLSVTSSPVLSTSERTAVESCASMSIVLRSLKTPRDVVRLFNVFRLRLRDCRREVRLDELLVFVLLELTAPEAIELVRDYPSTFLIGISYHPEFNVIETDDGTLGLLDKKEERETRKTKLFDELLPGRRRSLGRGLVDQLFSSSENVFGQDARTAASPHGLIKLLYGGGSPLSFSIKEVEDFLQDSDREKILNEKVAAGVFREWLIFASSISNLQKVRNPTSLARLLVDASTSYSDQDNVYSIQRVIGDYLTDLLDLIEDEQREEFLDAIINQRKNLAVSEDVILRLARSAGLWDDGRSFPIGEKPIPPDWKNVIRLETIIKIELKWLDQVRSEAGADCLHNQPLLASILHRWGQFNSNDYSEVQKYVAAFSGKHDPILIFAHFPLANSLDGLDKIIADPTPIRSALKRYSDDPEFRELAFKAVDRVERKHKEDTGKKPTLERPNEAVS